MGKKIFLLIFFLKLVYYLLFVELLFLIYENLFDVCINLLYYNKVKFLF